MEDSYKNFFAKEASIQSLKIGIVNKVIEQHVLGVVIKVKVIMT
ncbi:MAG: hypothetical protein Q4E39_05470 [bacterium]|nr:hypothetical protein [bacterium]